MLAKRVIPCLDVNNGRVVKGVNFVNLKDAGDPVEIAKAYDRAGADELVFLDITASSDARATVTDMVRQVAEQVFIPFTVGGGIRTVEDFKAILREGADKISVNSAAIADPFLISRAADKFGSQCVVVAIDAKRRPAGGWNIYKNGGRIDTGIDAVEWAARAEELGAGVGSFLAEAPVYAFVGDAGVPVAAAFVVVSGDALGAGVSCCGAAVACAAAVAGVRVGLTDGCRAGVSTGDALGVTEDA